MSSVVAARAQISALETRAEAAAQALNGVERSREAGVASTVEVLDAVREVQNAELALADARRDQLLAELELMALTGQLRMISER